MASYLDHPQYNGAQRKAMETAATFRSMEELKLAREKAAKDAETKRLRDLEIAESNRRSTIDREKEKAAENKKRLEVERQGLEKAIEARYFRANPAATSSDFERVKNSLLDEHFLAQARKTDDARAATLRGNDYSPM